MEELPGYKSLRNLKLKIFDSFAKLRKLSRYELFKFFCRLTGAMITAFLVVVVFTILYQVKLQKMDECKPDLMYHHVDIRKYRFDHYEVKTKDGYFLKVFRLRNRKFIKSLQTDLPNNLSDFATETLNDE